MDLSRLKELLSRAPGAKITVLGDFCLDKYLYIDAGLDEPSLETGLVAYQVTGKKLSPGGAGNVCANLAALTASVTAIGVVGCDGEGFELTRELARRGVDVSLMVEDENRCTSTYTKPMRSGDGGYKEMNRLDFKNFSPMSGKTQDQVIRALRIAAERSDAILAVDQFTEENCGVVNDAVKAELYALSKKYPDLVIYADSRAFIHTFRGTVIKCNNFEVVKVFRPEQTQKPTRAQVMEYGKKLNEKTGKPVFVTLGPDGMAVFAGNTAVTVPAVDCEGPFDFCGAGDSASSGIVLALSLGATPEEAALMGNLVASVTIQQIGVTGTATPDQLRKRFEESVHQNRP